MDEPYRYYIEQKKSNTQKECYVWFYLHRVQEQVKQIYEDRTQKTTSWGQNTGGDT